MKRIILWVTLVIGIIVITLSGCGGGSSGNNVTLQLNCFPYNYSSYDIVIYVQKDSSVMETKEFDNISGSFQQTITVASGANFLTVYLVKNNTAYFFWGFEKSGTCSTSYWLDYNKYFNNGTIVYGLSEDLERNASLNMSEEMTLLKLHITYINYPMLPESV